ncbi:MAG: PAS domain-containing sensor histidine kinase [Alphaproteobacteria bacterium]|nr:MAG: PAS domain-containing sensor histidine kinase [Alphaproteobacteria bacterium]
MAYGALGEGVSGAIVTLVDISRHVETERQLLALLDGSVQGLVVHRGRQPLFCNSALAEMVGFANREELLRQPSILPFLHEEDRDQIIANVQARLAGQEAPREYEFRLRSLTGQVIWVDCRASVVDWDGAPAVLAACFDITDKKKAEEARRHSEELFTRVFECSPDFMTLSRLSDSVFLNVNQSYLSTFGYTREEVIGKSAVDLGNWATPAERQRLVNAVLTNAVVQNLEARLRTKSGRIFSALMSAEILEIDGEEILLVVGRDISDRKAVEAALLESKEAADLANRSKSEFLANMSHELRTPLNAILGFSEIIKNQLHGPIPDPKYVEYAKDIHESGSHLLDIINDILDLSKIEAGRLEVHEQRISIRDVVAGCRRLIEPRASEAGVTLESHVAESLPALLADERLMKQILLNLLSNAVKFTPRGGRIEVSAGLTNNGSLQIAVSDTGIGMDADGIERALRPFGQVDTSLSRKHQGSGLGLPLVVAFTERQGGCFDLESAVGEGTRVTVTFPPEKLVSD